MKEAFRGPDYVHRINLNFDSLTQAKVDTLLNVG